MNRNPLEWFVAVLLLIVAAQVPVVAGMAQENQSKAVNAVFEDETIPLRTNAATVGAFINELSISLPPEARIDPPIDSALQDGMNVFLTGLSVTRCDTEEIVPVEIELDESWHYSADKLEVDQPGCAGLVEVSYTIFYYDGREVGRRRRETVIQKMQPQRVVYYRQLNEGDGPTVEQILEMRLKPGNYHVPPSRYKEKLTMEATAYEPGPQSCGRFASGNTSAGYEAGYGVVAVDPSIIPMHSRLYIEGYGYAVAGDRGGAIDEKRIDLGFMTVDECMEFGRREVVVYVLY